MSPSPLTLSSYQVAYAGSEDVGWAPVPAFDRPDADVSLFLLSANAIQYVGAVDDPWFSAHVATVVDDSFSYGIQDSLYTSDFLVTAMDCADQYQICNPTNGQCTEMSGITFVGTNIDIIGLNPLQSTIAGHLLSTQYVSRGSLYPFSFHSILLQKHLCVPCPLETVEEVFFVHETLTPKTF
jgi:hypothetical protein